MERKVFVIGIQRKKPLENWSITSKDIGWFVYKSKTKHRNWWIQSEVTIVQFKWNAIQAMILSLISLYLFIECFDSQTVFCTVFLLQTWIPLFPYFYICFSFIICCTKSKIQKFMIPKPFLQLKYILLIYRSINCVYTNYIVLIRYIRHQIDKLYGALLPFLVDGSRVASNIVSFITKSVFTRLLYIYNH